ncbi:hypothetical protein ACM1ZW_20745 [Pseudomonas sp. NFX71]|uniref:hypothetical protein n=1 Tax=Pseudomonas sp. NFX71 TaxID=3399121 RepID=UPI003A8438A1
MEIRKLSKFEATITSIFKSLMESYPTPCELDAGVAGYKAGADYRSIFTSAVEKRTSAHPSSDEHFFADIVRWLAAQSYLVFDKEDACKFCGAVMTEKGLKLCETLPNT